MESVSGSKLAFFSPNGPVNLVATSGVGPPPDTNPPVPTVAGAVNIEIFTAAFGGNFDPGFVAGAALQNATVSGNVATVGQTITQDEELLNGKYTVIDETGNETLLIPGNDPRNSNITVVGSSGDTIVGGVGTQLIDASGVNPFAKAGPETILSAGGATTVWAATGDSITGKGGGSLFVAGDGGSNMTIIGGNGNLTAFNLGTGNVINGEAATIVIDDGYGGSNNTIVGGDGPTTIIAGQKDVITSSAGDTLINAIGGAGSTINGAGLGAVTVWGGAGEQINTRGGPTTVDGAGPGSTVTGGDHTPLFVDGTLGSVTVNAATSTTSVWGGAKDAITGGTGPMTVDVPQLPARRSPAAPGTWSRSTLAPGTSSSGA